jgi:hypothetical protein
MKPIKTLLVIVCLFGLATWGYGATSVYLFGKGNFNMAYSGTYEEGVNDFSDTNAYQTFGGGFGFVSGARSFFGLEVHYNMAGTATLVDPSDDDTVDIDTYQYILGFLTFGFPVVDNPTLKLYIQAGGGGGYALSAEEKTYTSAQGFETIIEVPEKKMPFGGFAGLTVNVGLGPGMYLMASGRYQMLVAEETMSSIVVLGGIVFSF